MHLSLPFNEPGAVPGGSYLDDGEEHKVRHPPLEVVKSQELGMDQTITARAPASVNKFPR